MAWWRACWPEALASLGRRRPRPQKSTDERAIWELERAYWRYVQSNDLQSYRGLWHEAFLPAAIEITGEIGMAYYWITFRWVDKDGKGEPAKLRIAHAWRKDGKGWQIVGGMSMPENTSAQR